MHNSELISAVLAPRMYEGHNLQLQPIGQAAQISVSSCLPGATHARGGRKLEHAIGAAATLPKQNWYMPLWRSATGSAAKRPISALVYAVLVPLTNEGPICNMQLVRPTIGPDHHWYMPFGRPARTRGAICNMQSVRPPTGPYHWHMLFWRPAGTRGAICNMQSVRQPTGTYHH